MAHQSMKGSPVAHEGEIHNTIFEADLLHEADCVSSGSDGRITQQLHEAPAAE